MENLTRKYSTKSILLTTFIEGIAVMAVEILSARMVSPVYGTSITTWSFVLGITLLGLAAGYFGGGLLCKQEKPRFSIDVILMTGGIWLVLLPVFATNLLEWTISLDYYIGLVISLFLILFPTLFLLGTLSPILVHLIDKELKVTGLSSGKIFSISTLGGIIGALFFGLFMLPTIGVAVSFYILGAVIFLLSFLFRPLRIKSFLLMVLLLFGILAGNKLREPRNRSKTLYSSEGVLGQGKGVTISVLRGRKVRDFEDPVDQ